MNGNKSTYFSKKIQEIHANATGEITHSSDTIFVIKPNEDLYSLHPFFESLQNELKNGIGLESSLAFPCVQLEIHGKEAICDITIKKERGFLAILLFDYSQHYEHLHEAAQEKKSSLLKEQEHLLKAKHLNEKKAYLDFMRNRIDGKLIHEMEIMVKNIEALKQTGLDPEQRTIVQEIGESVGKFHLKAIQIREELDFDFNS